MTNREILVNLLANSLFVSRLCPVTSSMKEFEFLTDKPSHMSHFVRSLAVMMEILMFSAEILLFPVPGESAEESHVLCNCALTDSGCAEYQITTPADLELQAEQGFIQQSKKIGRGLRSYAGYVFGSYEDPTEVPRPHSGIGHWLLSIASMVDEPGRPGSNHVIKPQEEFIRFIRGHARNIGKTSLHWVDASAGLALAQRQTKARHLLDGLDVSYTSIDIIDWQSVLELLSTRQSRFFNDLSNDINQTGLTLEEFRRASPHRVIANVENVRLRSRADLITVIEGIMYYPDKLASIVHLYNQLSDNGLLIIASSFSMDRLIQWSTPQEIHEGETPLNRFLHSLRAVGVDALRRWENSSLDGLMIKKKPGTKMVLRLHHADSTNRVVHYPVSSYDRGSENHSVIDLIDDHDPKNVPQRP